MENQDIFSGSDSDDNIFKTNNAFAKSYDTWRTKEELNKMKTKMISTNSDDSSSSSEDEEVGHGIFEKDFFKTLSYIKSKDPRIYDQSVKFFTDETDINSQHPKKKKSKKMLLKDYERELLLNNPSTDQPDSSTTKTNLTYVEEQRRLREECIQRGSLVDSDDVDGVGGLFSLRQKNEAEQAKEDEDYKQWLAGEKERMANEEEERELQPLKSFWTDPKLDQNEKFLRDYILNEKFLTKDDDYIPMYDEVVHDSGDHLSEDEKEIEKQTEFENKYNFRFEEPDREFIKRYPRTIESSLRRPDDRRKLKRQEIKQRKLKEKEDKLAERRHLQELKKREYEDMLAKLKEVTGSSHIKFNESDFEEDFDPQKHDDKMQQMFDDEFYQEEETHEKPTFPEIDEYLEIEKYDDYEVDEPHCEDEDFNMDCDYVPPVQSTPTDVLEVKGNSKQKKKRKSLFWQAIHKAKPKFESTNKTYDEYLDEYYQFDCEDMIGDIPCRFKYRKVVPNSFGLTPEEILLAKDQELNRWCSLKKAVQYRPEHVEKCEQVVYQKKAANQSLKERIFASLYAAKNKPNTSESTTSQEKESTTTSGANNSFHSTNSHVNDSGKFDQIQTYNDADREISIKPKPKKLKVNVNEKQIETVFEESNVKRKKQKNKHAHQAMGKRERNRNQVDYTGGITDARLSAYGLNPKKFKNKLKYKHINEYN